MTTVQLPTDASGLTEKELLRLLDVLDASKGLSPQEVQERHARFGPNSLPETPPVPIWKLILQQFEDGLVRVLLAAAAVSAVMAVLEGDPHGFVEPLVILLILVLNAIVGVWQENRAEGAIEALKSLVPETAVVVRGSALQHVDAAELVPGDIVHVAVGQRVPADMRVLRLHSTTLRVDQSILNGESVEALKHNEVETRKAGKAAERFPSNMVFSGTAVVYGKATCVVVRTGASTEIGAIEHDVREQEEVKTPLQVKLDEFGALLSTVIQYICIAVFLVNYLRFNLTHVPKEGEEVWTRYVQPAVHSLKVAVALAVAAIPEGLPAVVTTCLALGTRRMASHNALVRDLPSVETLGRCTVICSDKTGTLTTNMMSVLQVFTVFDASDSNTKLREYHLEDSKFDVPKNAVRNKEGQTVVAATESDSGLQLLCTAATLCNDASLTWNAEQHRVEKVGEATEAALLTMAEKLGHPVPTDPHAYLRTVQAQWTKNTTLEFTRSRKSMSVHCTSAAKGGRSTHNLFVKGAPEEVLSRCSRVYCSSSQRTVPLTKANRAAILAKVQEMSGAAALRCIGFAFRAVPAMDAINLSTPSTFHQIESDMVFTGVAGMIDPPRMEVRGAIEQCHTAGIRVMVITGDNKDTAEAICRKIGVFPETGSTKDLSFTGADLDNMTLAQKRDAVTKACLFSRTDPKHKMMLVELLQEQRLICAMTGDGVNDAPALKRADIGIAMGSGTEVAKAASKMVLADDNFVTVVKAISEGRGIYNNTRQFIRYLISSNIGEVVCILSTGLLGIPDALEPIQLLWVNLVTDGLPATALGFNQQDPDIMQQPPRRTDEPIVNGYMFIRYMIVGTYVGLATVGGFLYWFLANGFTLSDLMSHHTCTNLLDAKCVILTNPTTARAIALSILVVVEMFNALNALSENHSIVTIRPSSNKWLMLAIFSSMFLHFAIMYVPQLSSTFAIEPLGVPAQVVQSADPWSIVVPEDFTEWKIVFVFSIPVLFLDELLKYIARRSGSH
ncbi:calcium-translocating P-type ATPase, putative [Bodo saltans]|uniref:Calcium-transporting ATPase n=1 Tax=Bodo saltans TaxID=75058 RepID=A0A0S4KIG5_BODSA|nr:calcium-translocating P-type ATPase, putative [Bodo saltans]|eukprot:CUI14093.1 calcium-translocating P-type ATPase, putative [Bodo saltans]